MIDGPVIAPRDRPVRVAYVLGGLPFGGIEKWLLNLCRVYARNGLVSPRVFNLSGLGQMGQDFLDAGIEVCNVGSSLRSITTYRLDTAFALRKKLRGYAPDIIHTIHFAANHLGRIASLGLGIPVLLHLRNTKHEKRWERRLSDKVLSYATTRYLAVSRAVAEVVNSDHNMAGRPVDVLYNAIDPATLDVGPLDMEKEFGVKGLVVVSVGRYTPQKNLDLLIRAMKILRDDGVAASLVLVGEGAERVRKPLEDLRDELGLGDVVVFTGFRDDVAAFYRAAHVFAAPSEYEGFLIAQLEAMYCGLPCVVSPHVPLLEIASEASLVCETNPADIAAKLREVLTNDELRAKLSEAATRIAKPHTMERYAVRLYDYYRAILGEVPFVDMTKA